VSVEDDITAALVEVERLRARAASSAAYRRRKRALLATEPGVVHGTVSTYSNYMCRCDLCREAKSVANAKRNRSGRAGREAEEVE